jgi:hypothetical protein
MMTFASTAFAVFLASSIVMVDTPFAWHALFPHDPDPIQLDTHAPAVTIRESQDTGSMKSAEIDRDDTAVPFCHL